MRLLGARIDGSIDLTGAHLADADGVALDLADAVVGGSVYLIGRRGGRGLRADGRNRCSTPPGRGPGHRPRRDDHRVRPVPGPQLRGPRACGGRLLAPPGCRWAATCSSRAPVASTGRVDLPLATLGRLTASPDCRFDAPGNTALDLTNAELASHLQARRRSACGARCG